MDSGVRNTLIWLLGFIALVLGLFFYSFFSARTLSDEQYQELGYYGFPEPRTISAFSLVNHNGEAVSEANFKGDWSLLFFGFTFCPDVCPTTMGVLARTMDRLEQRPQVILVSVDPERDTPEALQYCVRQGTGRRTRNLYRRSQCEHRGRQPGWPIRGIHQGASQRAEYCAYHAVSTVIRLTRTVSYVRWTREYQLLLRFD
jgi:hypothetical protein